MKGYAGKVAFVGLSSGLAEKESLPEKVYRNLIGGAGLGAKILYERMKAGADPLGPENILGFLSGLLVGTITPMATKYMVVTKSPLTRTWGDANSGGLLSSEIKAAGYDGIFFTGATAKPVYLFVHDGDIEIRDAADLWGKSTGDDGRGPDPVRRLCWASFLVKSSVVHPIPTNSSFRGVGSIPDGSTQCDNEVNRVASRFP